MRTCYWIWVIVCGTRLVNAQSSNVHQYVADLEKYGQSPVEFVQKALAQHDLIVFDDALHSAYEPFVFYSQLVNTKSLIGKINYIFLEVINTTSQPLLDSFLTSKNKDTTILRQALQDDYTGTGWRYQTYVDLFKTVWDHNQSLPDSLRINLVGVNPPIYWEAIHTLKDYELFQNTLASRDYAMYLEIVKYMQNFKDGKKGLFLCNTRHAYKNIRDAKGELYWNTNTFFSQRNPAKAFSIRIHNVSLSIEAVKAPLGNKKSVEGLDELTYKWIRMDGGRWDSAFTAYGNKPVAIPFKETEFGKTTYVGNHMMNVAKGSTMYDAFDALIFLAPLSGLHFTAMLNYIFTPSFKPELERRLRLIKGDDFNGFLKENHASNYDEYYKSFQFIPVTPNSLLND